MAYVFWKMVMKKYPKVRVGLNAIGKLQQCIQEAQIDGRYDQWSCVMARYCVCRYRPKKKENNMGGVKNDLPLGVHKERFAIVHVSYSRNLLNIRHWRDATITETFQRKLSMGYM
ncbi:unnamed protein product [Acanthoscelides obtectus]|uniref:Uncharacterized protein n=1 Tax=Acanthoscelides obtectus TaxID=200917 RepID=A0A9P0PBD2_ACAOB|nr:unnamed protein product [Acanthoscelides obtectus]CAK1646401.1 hypothetical protein AOBTE_LOCUS14613 [Acanthoscelides obtectus]